jgi:hypothetical protein
MLPPDTANALPFYKKVFDEMYRPRTGFKTSCAVCHPRKSKRILNEYGTALAEELGETGVNDRERVRRALKAIEHLLPRSPKRGD